MKDISQQVTYATLAEAVCERARDFSWQHRDNGETFSVGFNAHPPFTLDISAPEAADWFRKSHEDGWTIEPLTCHVIETLIELFEPRTALDIGAHFGFITMAMLRNTQLDHVHSVEMNPEAATYIDAHMALNPELDPQSRFTLHRVGLSDFDAPSTPVSYKGMRLLFSQHRHMTQTKIDILSLNGLIDRIGYVPDLIKVDIEGYEAKLIGDLPGILAAARPVVVMELHWEDLLGKLGGSRREVVEPFFDAGYRCAKLNWHQGMPKSNFMAEVAADQLDNMIDGKQHVMLVFF